MIVRRRRSPNDISAMARFMSRVLLMPSGCWLWVGSRSGKYGVFWHNGRLIGAHRFIKVVETGQLIPQKLEPDHLCRNSWCVNPAHSEIVTRRVNLSRSPTASTLNATKTHCLKGHLLSDNNVRTKLGRYGPQRVCILCDRERCRIFRQSRKQGTMINGC